MSNTYIRRFLKMLGIYEFIKGIYIWLLDLRPKEICHRRKMLSFYSQFIGREDLCFDIGANFGNRIRVFLKLGAIVVAVEPQKACLDVLSKKYGDNNRVIIIESAVGNEIGEAEILISNANTLSSLSREWIDSVISSGRFSDYRWDETAIVPITTLDEIIKECGVPMFCKIDVEGYEFQVIEGLSEPIRYISFEFTPELIDPAVHSIEYLSGLGTVKYNYSIGESMELALENWVDQYEMCRILGNLPDKRIFGDVYARFVM